MTSFSFLNKILNDDIVFLIEKQLRHEGIDLCKCGCGLYATLYEYEERGRFCLNFLNQYEQIFPDALIFVCHKPRKVQKNPFIRKRRSGKSFLLRDLMFEKSKKNVSPF